jgi:hypothetical protein
VSLLLHEERFLSAQLSGYDAYRAAGDKASVPPPAGVTKHTPNGMASTPCLLGRKELKEAQRRPTSPVVADDDIVGVGVPRLHKPRAVLALAPQ